MDTVRLGIVGMGNMGTGHFKSIRNHVKNMTVTAVCDIAEARREWCEKNLPAEVKIFSDADEMMASGLIDAILIAVPHYDHPKLAIAAFKAGLHVYNEKPAAVYTKQVLEMNEAYEKHGKEKGLVFSMGFQQRTRGDWNKIRDLIQSGQLGHIKKFIWIVTDWYRPQGYHDSCSWRSTWKGEGGGTLINQNPHNLDLVQWMFGMPDQVMSMCDYGKYYNIEVEDDVTAFYKYDSGTVGIYTTSTGEQPGTNRLEISADMGKVVCEGGKITFYRNVESEREFNKNFTGIFGHLENWKCEIPVPKPHATGDHAVLLQNFTNAILKGEALIAPGVDGINEMTLSNAIHYSDWLGNKWVSTKDFDHEDFYNRLMEKIANSKVEKNVVQRTTGTEGAY